MRTSGTTRRQFLKTAGSLGFLAVAHPLAMGCWGRSGGASPDYSRTISEMTAYIEQKMAADNVTGAAIALIDDQRIVWARGFGYADAARAIPVTSDTIFNIGSTSKTFAAAMILQLLALKDGMLLLDNLVVAPVSDTKAYRPGLARDLGAAVQMVNVGGEARLQCLGYRYRKV